MRIGVVVGIAVWGASTFSALAQERVPVCKMSPLAEFAFSGPAASCSTAQVLCNCKCLTVSTSCAAASAPQVTKVLNAALETDAGKVEAHLRSCFEALQRNRLMPSDIATSAGVLACRASKDGLVIRADIVDRLIAADAVPAVPYRPSRTDIKQRAERVSYEQLARFPARHDGKAITFKGRVLQVTENRDGDVMLRIGTRGGFGDVMYVEARSSAIENGRILEDDTVTVWGTSRGIKTYTAVMGNAIQIPAAEADIVERVEQRRRR